MKYLGCDVSYGRESETALVVWDYDPITDYKEIDNIIVETLTDLPSVVDFIEEQEEKTPFDGIAVDAIGFGRGALDYLNLKPFAWKVHPFIASSRASREWEPEDTRVLVDKMYANFKTRVAFELQKDAFRGLVGVPDHPRLVEEMGAYVRKRMDGRWKLVDPDDKSPDVADAALAGFSLCGDLMPQFWIGS